QPANVPNAAAPAQPAAPRPAQPPPRPAQPAPRPVGATVVQRTANPAVASRAPAPASSSKAPVVDLDPEDLDLDIDDSYSIGDDVGLDEHGHEGDTEGYKSGDDSFDIDDSFLQELEQAEQRALMRERDVVVLDLEDESQTDIKPESGSSKRRKVEEVIDISD
ncbi:hypothetical protein FRC08_009884, partial [Ceratobasidium sp. 394]